MTGDLWPANVSVVCANRTLPWNMLVPRIVIYVYMLVDCVQTPFPGLAVFIMDFVRNTTISRIYVYGFVSNLWKNLP